jgi:hypothetical protein
LCLKSKIFSFMLCFHQIRKILTQKYKLFIYYSKQKKIINNMKWKFWWIKTSLYLSQLKSWVFKISENKFNIKLIESQIIGLMDRNKRSIHHFLATVLESYRHWVITHSHITTTFWSIVFSQDNGFRRFWHSSQTSK